MRNIINISLPPELAEKVEREVAKGRYATKSEFFRALLRAWEEEQIFQEVQQARRDIARGKGRVLRSLKQLR